MRQLGNTGNMHNNEMTIWNQNGQGVKENKSMITQCKENRE